MILKIKLALIVAIGRFYYWFWHDFLRRREPFTWQIARMIRAHGALFWLSFVGGQFAAYNALQPPIWLSLAWLLANAWLIDHEIDHILDKPDDYRNV